MGGLTDTLISDADGVCRPRPVRRSPPARARGGHRAKPVACPTAHLRRRHRRQRRTVDFAEGSRLSLGEADRRGDQPQGHHRAAIADVLRALAQQARRAASGYGFVPRLTFLVQDAVQRRFQSVEGQLTASPQPFSDDPPMPPRSSTIAVGTTLEWARRPPEDHRPNSLAPSGGLSDHGPDSSIGPVRPTRIASPGCPRPRRGGRQTVRKGCFCCKALPPAGTATLRLHHGRLWGRFRTGVAYGARSWSRAAASIASMRSVPIDEAVTGLRRRLERAKLAATVAAASGSRPIASLVRGGLTVSASAGKLRATAPSTAPRRRCSSDPPASLAACEREMGGAARR